MDDAPAPTGVERTEPENVGSRPLAADEVRLAHRRTRLPDGIIFEPEGDRFAFHLKSASEEASRYSYIEPGDVELVHDRWLFLRDDQTSARVRRWSPRVVKLDGAQGEASINVGDRIELGRWTIEWIAIMPGSNAMSGVRVLGLRSFFDGARGDYWQSDGKIGARHDFSADEGLAQLEVVLARANVAREGWKSTLTLRLREVDRSTRVAFGAPVDPGRFTLPGGLRVRFEKGTLCATGPVACVCSDVFEVTAEKDGKRESFGIPNNGSVTKLRHAFRVVNGRLVVAK